MRPCEIRVGTNRIKVNSVQAKLFNRIHYHSTLRLLEFLTYPVRLDLSQDFDKNVNRSKV